MENTLDTLDLPAVLNAQEAWEDFCASVPAKALADLRIIYCSKTGQRIGQWDIETIRQLVHNAGYDIERAQYLATLAARVSPAWLDESPKTLATLAKDDPAAFLVNAISRELGKSRRNRDTREYSLQVFRQNFHAFLLTYSRNDLIDFIGIAQVLVARGKLPPVEEHDFFDATIERRGDLQVSAFFRYMQTCRAVLAKTEKLAPGESHAWKVWNEIRRGYSTPQGEKQKQANLLFNELSQALNALTTPAESPNKPSSSALLKAGTKITFRFAAPTKPTEK